MKLIQGRFFDKKGRCSCWVGKTRCSHSELINYLATYTNEDGEFNDQIRSEFGENFLINGYDDDFFSVELYEPSNELKTFFPSKNDLPDKELADQCGEILDDFYNCCIVISYLEYDGLIKEYNNTKYGYFKFLGTISE